MSKKHTPIAGGAWRVVDGVLVDEATVPAAPTQPPAAPATKAAASTHKPGKTRGTTEQSNEE